MSVAPTARLASPRLGEAPLVHPIAEVVGGSLGRFTEIAERCVVLGTTVGDYSYLMQDTQAWAARIGKFVNRLLHPRQRPQSSGLARDAASFHLSRQ
jgi:hypothetical protein